MWGCHAGLNSSVADAHMGLEGVATCCLGEEARMLVQVEVSPWVLAVLGLGACWWMVKVIEEDW